MYPDFQAKSATNAVEVSVESPSPVGKDSNKVVSKVDKSSAKPKSAAAKKVASKGNAAAKPVEWGSPIALSLKSESEATVYPEATTPASLSRAFLEFSQVYRVPMSVVATVVHFLTAAALGKGVRVRDHWGHERFPTLYLGVFGGNPLRLNAMASGIVNPVFELIRKYQEHYDESVASADADVKPDRAAGIDGETSRRRLERQLSEHGGCGSIMATDGLAALSAMQRDAGWFGRVIRGEYIDDALMTPCVNILAMLPSDSLSLTRGSAARILHEFVLVNGAEQPALANAEQGSRVSEETIKELREHFERCFRLRAAQWQQPLELQFDETAESARDAFSRQTGDNEPELTALLATKLAAILHVSNADMASDETPSISSTIQAQSWEDGLALAQFFVVETQLVHNAGEQNSAVMNARWLLEHAADLGPAFAQSEVYTNPKVKLRRKQEVMAAIDVLMDSGWLRVQSVSGTGGRGRPPVRYEWHPSVLEGWSSPITSPNTAKGQPE